jgi:hypothetical protein
MAKYRFATTDLTGIMSHIAAYGSRVLSMIPDGEDYYLLEIDSPIVEDQYQHLSEEYDFVGVN